MKSLFPSLEILFYPEVYIPLLFLFINVVLARAFIHVNRSCDFLESYIKSGGDKTDIRAYERFVRERKLRGNILIACVAIPIFIGYFIFAVSVFTGNK